MNDDGDDDDDDDDDDDELFLQNAMVDRRKVLSLIPSWEHHQWEWKWYVKEF